MGSILDFIFIILLDYLGKIGVAVSLSSNNETLAKQIAMHVAASNL